MMHSCSLNSPPKNKPFVGKSKNHSYFVRWYGTRPYQHQHHLDQKGKIKQEIIEKRIHFLKSLKLWSDPIKHLDRVVYLNRHLFVLEQMDQYGLSNLDRMYRGLRPFALDGDKLTIHHLDQTHKGTWVIIPEKIHSMYDCELHSQVRTSDPVNRLVFQEEGKTFWKSMAEEADLTLKMRFKPLNSRL